MAFMDMNILPAGAASLIVGLLTTVVALRLAAGGKVHPNEPTVLPSWIPFIGHPVGMAIYGGRYIKKLGYLAHVSCCAL